MKPFMYYNPTRLLFGQGQIKQLEKQLMMVGDRILIVYGSGSIKKMGLYDQVMDLLIKQNKTVFELKDVEPNPRLTTVEEGIHICKKHEVDFVLAIGGGSVIDCTKAIVVGAKTKYPVWDLVTRRERAKDGLPYGSIVTMAGTGAEMSLTSVITNWETKDKRAFSSSHFRAQFVIVDPTYMTTVPKNQTIYGSIDTMSHLMEHYFHPGDRTVIQDGMLESVMRSLLEETPKLLANLSDVEHRETLAYASTIALSDQLNMGFIGDWGTHHIDHALSAVYDIPHGAGMAILFPHWMRHAVKQGYMNRLKDFAMKICQINPQNQTDEEIALLGIDYISSLWESWGAPTKLRTYHIPFEGLAEIAALTKETVADCGNYMPLEEDDILAILQAAY
ncbi:MAG TPA: iron-containing alcohol dehydrogenase [Pseudogracilibacillus sp.]|nr:iron-containing alcohol dehydrogenase [Pseudogracilibacillus sp.]